MDPDNEVPREDAPQTVRALVPGQTLVWWGEALTSPDLFGLLHRYDWR